MNVTQEGLTCLLLNSISQGIRKSGLSREHCQKVILNSISMKCRSKEEKAYYAQLLMIVLDRAFPA